MLHAMTEESKLDAFSRDANNIGRLWAHNLVETDISAISSSKHFAYDSYPYIQINTKFGTCRLCGPVAVEARLPGSREIVADSAETLANLLKLPTSHHPISNWYGYSAIRYPRLLDGALCAFKPVVIVKMCRMDNIQITGRLGPDLWEPHLSGTLNMDLHWTVNPTKINENLGIPTELDISLSTDFGKFMWDCSKIK
jgi:hypothetical protein